MTEVARTKLINKSQIAGLARSSGDRKTRTRLDVEEACRQVYARRRPAVDSVLRQGAGRFSRASVEKVDRHGHVLKLWQRTWDEQHPEETERVAVRLAERSAARAQASSTAQEGRCGGETGDRRVAAQLEAALCEIGRLERQHLMDVELIEELKLDLRRAKAEPRPRLPRRFTGSGDDATHH